MFWPLVLPLQLTALLMGILSVAFIWVSLRCKWPRGVLVLGLLIGVPILSLPSCLVIAGIVDQFRFGMFKYPDFPSIRDFRVERYMPPTATNIDVFKHFNGNGYRASFTISKPDLDSWHNSVWVSYGQLSIDRRPKDDMLSSADISEFDRWFAEFGWTQPRDLVTYNGPRALNGAFYTIWYSPSEQKAFLTSGYW